MWKSIHAVYDDASQAIYNHSDPRTRDMPFMRRLDLVIILTVAYLAMVLVGPRIMANRKAFDLKWTMFAYNVVVAVFSGWMFVELLISTWKAGYNYACEPYRLSYDRYELRVVNVLWWYFLSKPIEFLDTAFMVLKKKNSQITVLHVWHHTFMFPCWWTTVLIGPCGQAVHGPILNTFIHLVMYSYYALSLFPALQPYLFWKKFLTQMQLTQFVLLLISSCYGPLSGCDYPKTLAYVQLAFMITLLILFGNFYVQSYVKRKQRHSTKSVDNGVKKTE